MVRALKLVPPHWVKGTRRKIVRALKLIPPHWVKRTRRNSKFLVCEAPKRRISVYTARTVGLSSGVSFVFLTTNSELESSVAHSSEILDSSFCQIFARTRPGVFLLKLASLALISLISSRFSFAVPFNLQRLVTRL